MYNKSRECSLGLFAWEAKRDGSKAWVELQGKTQKGQYFVTGGQESLDVPGKWR